MKVIKNMTPFRVGHWLPSDQAFLEVWIDSLIEETVATEGVKPLHGVIKDFEHLIESDPEIYMGFNLMFSQVPFKSNPLKEPRVKNYQQMLSMMNTILTQAPEYSKIADKVGLVGFPINAILDWSMGTTGGFWAFTNHKVNAQLKKILNTWAQFLSSKDSCYVLTDKPLKIIANKQHEKLGWFSTDALEALAEADPYYKGHSSEEAKENFIRNFKCYPNKPYWGFKSWDDFFTREYNTNIRPVASPDNDNVIVNACESAPYRIAYGVKKFDTFWIKAQPYSLKHLLANDPSTDNFVGGTIYQAFLSAKSYHRWHSPVSGTIKKVTKVEGTYYSETLAEGYDPAGPNDSQGYITEVATRALIFIEADNHHIGLMCVVPVGMSEVSGCEVTVAEGQHVSKGEQLGMFHFGGSTHCLIFSPQVKLAFDLHGQTPGLNSKNIPLNEKIATVCK